jgi:hypothetical protein
MTGYNVGCRHNVRRVCGQSNKTGAVPCTDQQEEQKMKKEQRTYFLGKNKQKTSVDHKPGSNCMPAV